MPTYQGRYTKSAATSTSQNSEVTFGADFSQSPVFLNVDIIPSHSFARLMLSLGKVVRMQDVGVERDYSKYQEWVKGEYIKELEQFQQNAFNKLPDLLIERKRLEKEKVFIQQKIKMKYV